MDRDNCFLTFYNNRIISDFEELNPKFFLPNSDTEWQKIQRGYTGSGTSECNNKIYKRYQLQTLGFSCIGTKNIPNYCFLTEAAIRILRVTRARFHQEVYLILSHGQSNVILLPIVTSMNESKFSSAVGLIIIFFFVCIV